MIKLSKIQLPINERVVDDKGMLTRAWKNELQKLQVVINALVDKANA